MPICKYCGEEFPSYSNGMKTCGRCRYKYRLVQRFAKARDDLRELTGLPPLERPEWEQQIENTFMRGSME